MLKKFGLFVAILLWSTGALAENFPFVGTVTKDGVNVRSGASVNFESLYQAKTGDKVVVRAKSYYWYQIDLPSEVEVFISQKYVKADTDGCGEVTGNRVNVRAKPGERYTIIGQVKKGQEVKITGSTGDWFSIRVPDSCRGWIHESFVKFLSEYIEEEVKAPTNPEPFIVYEEENTEKVPEEKKIDAVVVVEIAPPQPQEKQAIEVEGLLEQRGRTFGKRFGSHKLLVNGKPAYYLEGDSALLNSFIHFKVKVTGRQNDIPASDLPVITVEKINPAR